MLTNVKIICSKINNRDVLDKKQINTCRLIYVFVMLNIFDKFANIFKCQKFKYSSNGNMEIKGTATDACFALFRDAHSKHKTCNNFS